ncbi:hypothetical protein G9A89_002953 [Geosiphon pyriformis]|nr:hypothetical protein G9A89_002953 [Geosiphon pyriformis]
MGEVTKVKVLLAFNKANLVAPGKRSTVKLEPPAPSSTFFPGAGEGIKEKRNTSVGTKSTRANHAHALRYGNTDHLHANLKPALDGVPKQLCMIVKDMPTSIFHTLIQNYGDLQTYTKTFGKLSRWINLSKNDWNMQLEVNARLEGASQKLKNAATEDISIWKKSVTNVAEIEFKLMREGIVHQKEKNEGELEAGDQEVVEDLAKTIRGRKKEAETDGRKLRKVKRVDVAWNSIKEFYDKHEIDAKWLRNNRCSYMMDAWNVLDRATGHTKGDSDVTPDLLRAAKMTSADCKWLHPGAKHALLQLQNLVLTCLKTALGEAPDLSSNDWQNTRPRMKTQEVPKEAENISFRMSEFDPQNYQESIKCYLDSGILKQGLRPVHQALHIDNSCIVDWNITKRIWFREEVSPEEWMKCGYVIDLPLSEEGSWLRVAIPDPNTKAFVMDWIFVPYGSFLVRSSALFHSGHYGSPGNTRFHATFSIQGTNVAATELEYLRDLGTKTDFTGWTLKWNKEVPESCRGPDGYQRYSNRRVRMYKGYGTNYLEKAVLKTTNLYYPDILRNLSPYKELPVDVVKKEGGDLTTRKTTGVVVRTKEE